LVIVSIVYKQVERRVIIIRTAAGSAAGSTVACLEKTDKIGVDIGHSFPIKRKGAFIMLVYDL